MCQWDKDSCADAGFLKIDLLGLGMLSAVEECVDLIAKTPRRADRPLARAARRPGRLRRDPAGRHGRLLPDREPRADAGHPPHAAGDDRRHHGAGRARAAGADPGEGACIRTSSGGRSCATTRRSARRPTIRCSRNRCARRSASSSSRTRCSTSPSISRASAVGEAEGLRRAMSRKRSHAALEAWRERFVAGALEKGVEETAGARALRQARRLLGLRLPEVALGGVRAARVPVGVAAAPLRAGVPRGAPQRAADGLLSAGDARPRRAEARGRDAAAAT